MSRATLASCVLLAACAAPTKARAIDADLDLSVDSILRRTRARHLDERPAEIELPAPARAAEEEAREPAGGPAAVEDAESAEPAEPGADATSVDSPPSDDAGATAVLGADSYDLRRSLATAFRSNRGMISRRESLYLQVLSLIGTRHGFSPQLSALLSASFADSEVGLRSFSTGFSPSLSQRLRHGGSLTLSGSTSWSALEDAEVENPDEYDASVSLRLSQPLLRGFGYDVSHESLVQAERDLIYAVRDFELFREDFSIEVAQRYYGLVEQWTNLENQRQNIEVSIFQRRKAEALYAIGRSNQIELFRAQRQELQDRNSLIQAEQAYELALDRYKIFLGLDTDTPIAIVQDRPPQIEVDYDPEDAIRIAKQNRLDYLTRKERLEDSARGLRIARDGLRSDLNLTAGVSLSGDDDTSLADTQANDAAWDVGLSWDLPVDRVRERNSHRSAQIGHQRALRDFEEFDDNLTVEIRSSFRELARVRQSIDIQDELISSQERNLKKAQIEYEAGQASNREVVDAQQALIAARNAKIRERVNYEIARLRLLRDLGILFVDAQGMWMEP